MTEAVNKMMKYDTNGPRQTKFDEAVLELLAVNCLPFDLVNSLEFKALVQHLDKRITVKDRKTYQRKMKSLATAVLSKIKKMINLHCDLSCAITSDIWSSRSQDGYISGTLHFIDEKFRLHHWTPFCEPMTERHTGDVIKSHIDGMIERLELKKLVSQIMLPTCWQACGRAAVRVMAVTATGGSLPSMTHSMQFLV